MLAAVLNCKPYAHAQFLSMMSTCESASSTGCRSTCLQVTAKPMCVGYRWGTFSIAVPVAKGVCTDRPRVFDVPPWCSAVQPISAGRRARAARGPRLGRVAVDQPHEVRNRRLQTIFHTLSHVIAIASAVKLRKRCAVNILSPA